MNDEKNTSILISNLIDICARQSEQLRLVRGTQAHVLYAIFACMVTAIWQRLADLPTPVLVIEASLLSAFVLTEAIINRIAHVLDSHDLARKTMEMHLGSSDERH